VTTGGHGGVIGAVGYDGPPRLTYLPQTRHSFSSQVNISQLPAKSMDVRTDGAKQFCLEAPIKDGAGFYWTRRFPR
jgi:L-asparaginase